METKPTFTSTFERDHVQMTVTVAGTFTADDVELFQEAATAASRGRRREWTVDAQDLTEADPTFVDALLWLRAEWGHVCLLNPSAALRAMVEAAGADRSMVVRSDARARSEDTAG